MKVFIPVLEGYNIMGRPVFGQREATPKELIEIGIKLERLKDESH